MCLSGGAAYIASHAAPSPHLDKEPSGPVMKLLEVENEEMAGGYLLQGLSESGFVVELDLRDKD